MSNIRDNLYSRFFPSESRCFCLNNKAINFSIALILFISILFYTQVAHSENLFRMAQQKELQWSQRLNSGNIIELNDMYEPDAWLILPGLQPFINLDNVSKGLEMILKDVKKIELTTVDIHAIGRDFLVENGKAKIWRYSSSGEKHEFSNYEVIWHRDSNGMWKIMRDIVVPM